MPKIQATPIDRVLSGKRVLKEDHVEGVMRQDNLQNPDRWFYLYDPMTEAVWECDGYKKPVQEGEKEAWFILLKCPACQSDLRLETGKKSFEITARGLETGEPIGCSYFVEVDGYKGMCPWRAELQPPKKQMIMEVRTASGRRAPVRIDAIVRPAK